MELKDSLKELKNFGKTQIELDFVGLKMAFRNLTAGDDYELNAELGERGIRDLAYFYAYKVYGLARTLLKMDEVNSENLTEEERSDLEEILRESFFSWDSDSLNLLYKAYKARSSLFAAQIIQDKGIECFLFNNELEIYRQYQLLKEIEAKTADKAIHTQAK